MLTANCVFSTTTVGSPRKYVNRMHAMCLTFNPSGAVTTSVIIARCAPSGTDAKRQLFIWQFTDATVAKSGLPREYTTITGTRTDREVRCLDSAGASDAPGTNAAALNCTRTPPSGLASSSGSCRATQPPASRTTPARGAASERRCAEARAADIRGWLWGDSRGGDDWQHLPRGYVSTWSRMSPLDNIVEKVFLGREQKFLEPLIRFARGE